VSRTATCVRSKRNWLTLVCEDESIRRMGRYMQALRDRCRAYQTLSIG
jgi:hypothetical protein